MPGSLKYYKSDPERKGRGAGLYYHRGKGVYSKYELKRDKKKKSQGWKTDLIGIKRTSKLLHTMDGNIFRR